MLARGQLRFIHGMKPWITHGLSQQIRPATWQRLLNCSIWGGSGKGYQLRGQHRERFLTKERNPFILAYDSNIQNLETQLGTGLPCTCMLCMNTEDAKKVKET